MPQPDLSVIIVNWNTRDLLRRCLDSLSPTPTDSSVPSLQIIVVDNASRDGSEAMLRRAYPAVTLIENTTNVGFARANNQGAAHAAAPLLLLLNSDAAVRPGALAALVDTMRHQPRAGIIGLQLLNDDGTLQPSGKRLPSLLSTIIGVSPLPRAWRVAYDLRRNRRDFSQPAEVGEVSAAAMAVRRDLYQLLGGFDEGFYFFGEDVDLCWRAGERGYAILYLPTAQAIHSWGGARARTPSIRQGLLSQRAQYRLMRRHATAWQVALLRAYLIVFTLARLLRAVGRARTAATPRHHAIAHLYARELLWLLTT